MSTAALLASADSTIRRSPEADGACRALMQSPYRHLHGLACDLEDGELVLRGTLGSYYLKQLAQEVIRKATGCWTLRNDIAVLVIRK